MPRSVVIYTSREVFSELEEALRTTCGDSIPAYTLSFPQRADAGLFRVRVTELVDGTVMPVLALLAERGRATFASASDPDVKAAAYEELAEDADRFNREITLQFSSPTMVELGQLPVSFPVIPLVFAGYQATWNSFSPVRMEVAESIPHLRLADFKISCAPTRFGTGYEGWVRLEIDRGRTEEEIARLNTLADFAFFAGTGLYTNEGLGQTRRKDSKTRQ